ncbi:T9SS type A sorting domain-containing protein [bacterium]|nr:T9SS type A sorting domain-containing protein [bacterium]
MKRSIILFVLLSLLTLSYSQENLLLNPTLDGSNAHWIPSMLPDSVPPGFAQEWCADCGVGGSGGLHINVLHAGAGFFGFMSLVDTVVVGEKYVFSTDVKFNALQQPVVTMAFINESYELLGAGDIFPLLGHSEWLRIQGQGKAPEGAAAMLFVFGSDGTGEAWLDNCYLGTGDTSYREITVNYDSDAGRIRNLSGTNRGPINPRSWLDLTDEFEEMNIPIVRTHDWYGPGDRHDIFPDWDADPNDPASYDFSETDIYVTAIVDAGAEVFFRLGESWEDDPVFNVPPPDNAVWANVCKHTVMHYNDGWAEGFYYDIRYWEIWNEPDIDWFWDAPYEEYYEMYIAVAETLKAYDPTLIVGGPAMAGPPNGMFLNGMLSAIDSAGAPLEFFSWHRYDNGSAFNYVLLNRWLKQWLDEFSFYETELILNEWNLAAALEMDFELANSPYNAAVATGVLMLMQNEDISQVMRYRTDGWVFGLWDDSSYPTYPGLGYLLMARLYDCPVRLEVADFESTSCAVLAGKSEDGDRMAVLVSDWNSSRNGYELHINELPSTVEYAWRLIAIDDSTRLEIIDSGSSSEENLVLEMDMRSPAVHLVTLEGINTGIEESEILPEKLSVRTYPNPFNSTCRIRVEGVKMVSGSKHKPMLEIFDVTGRSVKKFSLDGGNNEVIWDAGSQGSGVYFIRIVGIHSEIREKVLLLK